MFLKGDVVVKSDTMQFAKITLPIGIFVVRSYPTVALSKDREIASLVG